MAYTHNTANAGEFQERDFGKWFTYRTNSRLDINAMPHEIDVGDGLRFGEVKKTVAYISVDENADGSPVVEKWALRAHNIFKGN